MSRHRAREEAFKIIFERSFLIDENINDILQQYYQDYSSDDIADEKEYMEKVVIGVDNNIKSLDEIIEKNSIAWKKNRISRVAFALMRIAIFEIDNCNDISTKVSINEAVELAKKYDSPEAASFINGVLGGYVNNRSDEQ